MIRSFSARLRIPHFSRVSKDGLRTAGCGNLRRVAAQPRALGVESAVDTVIVRRRTARDLALGPALAMVTLQDGAASARC